MRYHKLSFRKSIKRNFKILLCRIFGHRINENPAHDWCERCNLCYSEAYQPLDWFYMTGITNEIHRPLDKDICEHPPEAMLWYDGDGHGEDECAMCGYKFNC